MPQPPCDPTFRDAVTAHATRTRLDELLLDTLAAPGMATDAAQRLVGFISGGDLERGAGALRRVQSAAGPAGAGGAGATP